MQCAEILSNFGLLANSQNEGIIINVSQHYDGFIFYFIYYIFRSADIKPEKNASHQPFSLFRRDKLIFLVWIFKTLTKHY